MKTIEEKAKAYDNALGWMREVYPTLTGATKEDAEHYFPELRESEDERIRKKLIGIFTNQSLCDVYNLKSEDVLAYLNKQKEHVPENEESGTRKEQKPTWSEEDEKHINNILDIIDYWKATARFVSYQDGTAVDRDINWLKSLRPQPKQEWSEEDKKMLDDIIVFISGYADKRVVAEWVNFLKSLRPSWKPTQEQMRELKYFLDYHRPQRNAGTTAWKEYDSVESLYNNLLELK